MDGFVDPNRCYIALDQGGHGSRAIVFDVHGVQLASAEIAVATLHPDKDRVEHDPMAVVDSLTHAIDDVCARLGERAQQIVACGLATQRSSLVCWDRHSGEALSPVISWQDRRAAGWLKARDLDNALIHERTGLYVTAHYGASKYRWCLDHLDSVRKAKEAGRLVMGPMASFLARHLLQEHPCVADPANASRTLLWNIKTRDWDAGLMAMFDLDVSDFPECVPSRHDFGHIEIAGRAVPMRIVTGDQSAAMYAFGYIQPDTIYVNAGTGAFVSRPAGHQPIHGRRLLTSIIHADDHESTYVLEGTVNGAGSAIEWAVAQLGMGAIADDLPHWLDEISLPPLFLNGISGLGAPFWVADFESRFVGEGDERAKIVAVVESVVFLIWANMSEMMKFCSVPEQVQLSGGLANIDAFCQKLSDMSRLPLYRPVEREATARGTAYLVAGCPESWPEGEIGRWFKPAVNAALRQRYEQWAEHMLKAMRHEITASRRR